MDTTNVFLLNQERASLIVAPLRNISSLAEEDVQAQWDDLLSQLDQPDIKHVVFDFEKINYFGSSMLEAMLFLWKRISDKNGKMAVCHVSDTATEILKLSRFDTIWPIYSSKDKALDYVNGQSA